MSFLRNHSRVLLIAAICAALGAGASAIATAGASSGPAKSASVRGGGALGKRGLRRGALRMLARSVHGTLVVPTRTGFENVTFDRGSVQSVSGGQVTMAEGTKKATYKTITLTIPGTAVVRENGKKTALRDIKPGQRVIVVQAPKRTLVIVHDPHKAS
jgi:hypothetical protein